MILKSIPYFKEHDIREAFLERARAMVDPSPEEKTALQNEYIDALQAGRKAAEIEREATMKSNTDAFLANPKAIIKELEDVKMQGYSTGEKMRMYGIGTVSSKRHGKGQKVGIGSDFPHTISQFIVTAKIGPHERIDECGSANDKYFKASMEAMVLGMLASDIASKSS